MLLFRQATTFLEDPLCIRLHYNFGAPVIQDTFRTFMDCDGKSRGPKFETGGEPGERASDNHGEWARGLKH
jgi:hypothetical protein